MSKSVAEMLREMKRAGFWYAPEVGEAVAVALERAEELERSARSVLNGYMDARYSLAVNADAFDAAVVQLRLELSRDEDADCDESPAVMSDEARAKGEMDLAANDLTREAWLVVSERLNREAKRAFVSHQDVNGEGGSR